MYTGMSPPISSTVKERVIQLYLQGKGRNEIAEILNLSHIRISQGSVTNILRTYKANTGKASTTRDFLKASEPSGSPSQLQTSPTSEMKQEAQIPVSEGPDPFQEPPSIEDAKDPEELKGLEVPIALATHTHIFNFNPIFFIPIPSPGSLFGGIEFISLSIFSFQSRLPQSSDFRGQSRYWSIESIWIW